MRWSLCWYRQPAVNRSDAGSIPAAAACDIRKKCALGRAAKAPAFQAGKASSTPAGHLSECNRFNNCVFGDRLTVGFLSLKQAMKVRILLPELCRFAMTHYCGAVAAGSDARL
jgi:hypothetical protein